MNIDFGQSNVFHSSITFNSIKPNLNEIDEIGLFRDGERQHFEIERDSLKSEIRFFSDENQSIMGESLFGKFFAESENRNDNFNEPLTWIKGSEDIGLSESEFESEAEQIQILSTDSQQESVIQKSKSITKSKISIRSSLDQDNPSLRQQAKRFQNQTKNLPKNYGKAIIAFALKHFNDFRHLPQFKGISFQNFKQELVFRRKQMSTISGLKSMWINFKYGKCMRMLSNLFLRRHALSYIFNSKISNISPHVKYRYKLLQSIKSPGEFSSIKDF